MPTAPERKAQSPRVRQLLSQWERLGLKEDEMCRTIQDQRTNAMVTQIVVQHAHVQALLEAYHSRMGHQALWRHSAFGCPEVLRSDQGPNFESALLRELCRIYLRLLPPPITLRGTGDVNVSIKPY